MAENTKENLIPTKTIAYLELYSTKCVTCTHLFPTHPKAKAHNSCHYKKGNKRCPAYDLNFIVGVDRDETLDNILKSFEEDDILAVIKQLNELVKIPKEKRQGLISNLLKNFKKG